MYHSWSSHIHPLVDIYTVSTYGCLWTELLKTVCAHVFVCDLVFTSLRCIHRNGIARSYENCLTFWGAAKLFPQCITILHSVYILLITLSIFNIVNFGSHWHETIFRILLRHGPEICLYWVTYTVTWKNHSSFHGVPGLSA